jgi:hypothetical protein
MAMAGSIAKSAPSDNDWRAEDDQRTLMRACEIMADRVRMNSVIKVQAKQKAAVGHLDTLLARHKRAGKLKGY